MPDVLKLHADGAANRPAVIVDSSGGARPETVTFSELNVAVNRVAHGLRALGVEPGDRIVWCGPNSLEVITVIHAARKAGLVAVPLSYRFTAQEMAYVVDNSEATAVVADAEVAPLLASVRHEMPNVRAFVGYVAADGGRDGFGHLPDGFTPLAEVAAGQPDTEPSLPTSGVGAQMLYTSGTTGKPKGALRTTTNPTVVLALLAELGLQLANEVHVTTGPLYHSGPLAFAGISHTLASPVVVLRRFDPVAWLRVTREHRVTNTFSAPTQLKRIVSLPPAQLAEKDLSSMRCLIANAAPVPYALKREVVQKLGDGFLFEVYGSTELGIITVMRPEDQLRKPGSCGRPYDDIQIRIVKDDGTLAGPGEPGELFMSTALAMDGYHRSEEQLAEIEGGRWKSVGDVAYVDDEGYVYICDRKKDMIISGGVNIYPAEIEAAVHEHSQVLDAAVFGVPDEEWGESVYCIVQPKAGQTIDLDELRAFVEARVASYMRPRAYEVREELPRTESGKLLKRNLRDEFWKDRTTAV